MAWYNASWTKRRLLTIDHTKVVAGGDYTDFPVLVSLSGLSGILANGADIRFTGADGVTELPREIESYAGGVLVAWVKTTLTKTASDSSDDVIYMYYGNAGATEPAAGSMYGSQAVWSNGYAGVWHLDDPGPTTALDSTANANHGTQSGGVTFGQTGMVGKACSFDGSNDYISAGNDSSLDFPTSSFTLAAWATAPSNSSKDFGILEKLPNIPGADPGYGVRIFKTGGVRGGMQNWVGGFSTTFTTYNSGVQYDDGMWHRIIMTVDRVTNWQRMYVDGVNIGNTNIAYFDGSISNTGSLWMARRADNYEPGLLDEAIVNNTIWTSQWIATEYSNQSSPATFLTAGDEELPSGILIDRNFPRGIMRGVWNA